MIFCTDCINIILLMANILSITSIHCVDCTLFALLLISAFSFQADACAK